MSRKHFEALAYALGTTGASDEVVRAIADVCIAANGAFDRGRFEARVEEWRAR